MTFNKAIECIRGQLRAPEGRACPPTKPELQHVEQARVRLTAAAADAEGAPELGSPQMLSHTNALECGRRGRFH